MSNIWFTSDTHFGHEKIIEYCRPEFNDVFHMTHALMDNWNSRIKPNDVVYHGGDMLWRHPPPTWDELNWAEYVMKRLNGRIRLILGNHDNAKLLVKNDFVESICAWGYFKKEQFVQTHFPLPRNQTPPKFVNVHGHTHNNQDNEPHQINICVEHTLYHPVHLDELLQVVKTTRNMMEMSGE